MNTCWVLLSVRSDGSSEGGECTEVEKVFTLLPQKEDLLDLNIPDRYKDSILDLLVGPQKGGSWGSEWAWQGYYLEEKPLV